MIGYSTSFVKPMSCIKIPQTRSLSDTTPPAPSVGRVSDRHWNLPRVPVQEKKRFVSPMKSTAHSFRSRIRFFIKLHYKSLIYSVIHALIIVKMMLHLILTLLCFSIGYVALNAAASSR